jgi:tetratricopeptide (TPR) repeat protein
LTVITLLLVTHKFFTEVQLCLRTKKRLIQRSDFYYRAIFFNLPPRDNMKKTSVSNKLIIIPLILLFVIQALTIVLVLTREPERQSRREEILKHIEQYYEKGDFEIAQTLAVNLLMNKSNDPEATGWLEKLSIMRKPVETAAPQKESIRIVENSADAKIMKEQTQALHNLKKSIDEMKNSNTSSPVIINTTQEKKPEGKTDGYTITADDLGRFLINGIAAYKASDYHAAESALLKVLSQDEKNPSANAYLGAVYYAQNPQSEDILKKALAYSKKALESDQSNKLAYVTLGRIYESKGNLDLAVINYLEAAAIDPKDAEILFRIGRSYYLMKDDGRANDFLLRAIKINQEIPFTYYYLGIIAKKKTDKQSAVDYLTTAVQYDREFYGAYGELAEIYFDLSQFGKAIEDFKKALAIKDGFLFRTRIGDCFLKLGQSDYAASEYRQALETQVYSGKTEKARGAEIAVYLVEYYRQKGNQDEAYRSIQIVLAKGAETGTLYTLKGEIEVQKKLTQSAEESFKNAIRLDPTAVDANCSLALLYAALGRKGDADGLLKDFLRNNPKLSDNPKVMETLKTLKN